jgi:hypothetical protein
MILPLPLETADGRGSDRLSNSLAPSDNLNWPEPISSVPHSIRDYLFLFPDQKRTFWAGLWTFSSLPFRQFISFVDHHHFAPSNTLNLTPSHVDFFLCVMHVCIDTYLAQDIPRLHTSYSMTAFHHEGLFLSLTCILFFT